MAKNKDLGPDIPIDDNIDLDEVDRLLNEGNPYDQIEVPADGTTGKRKPITEFAQGVGEAVKQVNISIPPLTEELGRAFPYTAELVDDSLNVVSDISRIKNDVTATLAPTINHLKQTGRRVLPRVKSMLPESVYDKIYEKLEPTQQRVYKDNVSKEEVRTEKIQSELANIFKAKDAQDHQEAVRKKTDDYIASAIERSEHKELATQLDTIRGHLAYQTRFSQSSLRSYLIKSLELKYRHIFVSQDTLEITKLTLDTLDKKLTTIAKNTSLPDVQKKQGLEFIKERSAEKLIGKGFKKAGDWTKNFRTDLMKNLRNLVKDKTEAIKGGLQFAAGAAEDYEQLQEMQDIAGPDPDERSGTHKAGNFVTSMLMTQLGRVAIRKGSEFTGQYGKDLDTIVNTLKGKALYKLNDKIRNMPEGALKDIAKIIPTIEREDRAKLDKTLKGNVMEEIPFDVLTRRSIVEIIPGYLAKILQQATNIATGRLDAEELQYNVEKEDFLSESVNKAFMTERYFGTKGERTSEVADSVSKILGAYTMYGGEEEEFYDNMKDVVKFLNNSAKYLQPIDPAKIAKLASGEELADKTYENFVFKNISDKDAVIQLLNKALHDREGRVNVDLEGDLFRKTTQIGKARDDKFMDDVQLAGALGTTRLHDDWFDEFGYMKHDKVDQIYSDIDEDELKEFLAQNAQRDRAEYAKREKRRFLKGSSVDESVEEDESVDTSSEEYKQFREFKKELVAKHKGLFSDRRKQVAAREFTYTDFMNLEHKKQFDKFYLHELERDSAFRELYRKSLDKIKDKSTTVKDTIDISGIRGKVAGVKDATSERVSEIIDTVDTDAIREKVTDSFDDVKDSVAQAKRVIKKQTEQAQVKIIRSAEELKRQMDPEAIKPYVDKAREDITQVRKKAGTFIGKHINKPDVEDPAEEKIREFVRQNAIRTIGGLRDLKGKTEYNEPDYTGMPGYNKDDYSNIPIKDSPHISGPGVYVQGSDSEMHIPMDSLSEYWKQMVGTLKQGIDKSELAQSIFDVIRNKDKSNLYENVSEIRKILEETLPNIAAGTGGEIPDGKKRGLFGSVKGLAGYSLDKAKLLTDGYINLATGLLSGAGGIAGKSGKGIGDLLSGGTSILKGAANMYGGALSGIGRILSGRKRNVKINLELSKIDHADLYKFGSNTPVLTADELKAGIRDQKGKIITKLKDMKNPPFYHPESGEIIISVEDFAKGLGTKDGIPLMQIARADGASITKGLGAKAVSSLGRIAERTHKLGTGMLGDTYGMYMNLFNTGISGIKGLGKFLTGKLTGGMGESIDKKSLKDIVGDRLQLIYELLEERLPERVRGDVDSDGDREGSYEDYLQKKKIVPGRKGKRYGSLAKAATGGVSEKVITKLGDKIEDIEDSGGVIDTVLGTLGATAAGGIAMKLKNRIAKSAIGRFAGKVFSKKGAKTAAKGAAKSGLMKAALQRAAKSKGKLGMAAASALMLGGAGKGIWDFFKGKKRDEIEDTLTDEQRQQLMAAGALPTEDVTDDESSMLPMLATGGGAAMLGKNMIGKKGAEQAAKSGLFSKMMSGLGEKSSAILGAGKEKASGLFSKFFGKGTKSAVGEAGEVAAKKAVTKAAAKGAAKSGGKILAKSIPFLGLIVGAGFAAHRVMKGDWAGAGLELAAGAASTFLPPGFGTAATVAIEGALIAKDIRDIAARPGADIENARFRAYGFPNPSKDMMETLLKLEEWQEHLLRNKKNLTGDHLAQIAKQFGVGDDPNDKEAASFVYTWFKNRFTVSLTLFRGLLSSKFGIMNIKDSYKLSPEQANELVKAYDRLVAREITLDKDIIPTKAAYRRHLMKNKKTLSQGISNKKRTIEEMDKDIFGGREVSNKKILDNVTMAASHKQIYSDNSNITYLNNKEQYGGKSYNKYSNSPSMSGGMVSRNFDTDSMLSGEIGMLSAKHESGKKGSSAVGYDRTGGTSYGKYQIASAKNKYGKSTFDSFLSWVETQPGGQEVAERLRAAGVSNTGRRIGRVPTEWRQLVKEGKMGNFEHEFIKATHYDPAYNGIKDSEFKARIDKSKALRDVMWSTAVQHSGVRAAQMFNKAYSKDKSDIEIIKDIYADRSTRFKSSKENIRQSVWNRFKQEQAEAIAMINRDEELKRQMSIPPGHSSHGKEVIAEASAQAGTEAQKRLDVGSKSTTKYSQPQESSPKTTVVKKDIDPKDIEDKVTDASSAQTIEIKPDTGHYDILNEQLKASHETNENLKKLTVAVSDGLGEKGLLSDIKGGIDESLKKETVVNVDASSLVAGTNVNNSRSRRKQAIYQGVNVGKQRKTG